MTRKKEDNDAKKGGNLYEVDAKYSFKDLVAASPPSWQLFSGKGRDDDVKEEEEKEVKYRYRIPSTKEEIPSLDEMTDIKEEISALRQQFRQTTIEKQMLHQQIQVLDETKRSSTAIDDSISTIIGYGV